MFKPAILHALFFASGAAGLGYQFVWARMFSIGLGHEIAAVLAIVCAFMGGMALGSWALANRISSAREPGKWYVGLEFVIGIWGVVSVFLIPIANELALRMIGPEATPLRHWTVAFIVPFVVVLPGSAAMGATFQAMERFLRAVTAKARAIGGIYAANTAGAVAGTLLTTFWIMSAIGLRRSLLVLASINILCGVVALGMRVCAEPQTFGRRPAEWTLFVTGLLGIGYEIVGIRILSGVLENTVYTFGIVLAVFLAGTSIGAALYQRFKWDSDKLPAAAGLACLSGAWALVFSQQIYNEVRDLGLLGEMLVACAVFFLPTICMGALFSHLMQRSADVAGGVGRGFALNTFGAALAPAVFGVLLLPWIGSKYTLVLIAVGYAALQGRTLAAAFVVLAAMSLVPVKLQILSVPAGNKVVAYHEGVMASVAVLEEPTGHRTLRINNRFQQGGTAAAQAEYRHADVPLLLHPNPRKAMFLGLGTGITLGASTLYPGLQADGVELVPEVLDVMPQFEPYNFSPTHHPNLRLTVADARRFVRTTVTHYDVIVADLFHPAMDGAGMLYTVEHYRAIRARLNNGGIFCQWLPLYQLDEGLFRIIARTFLDVFPEAQAWLLRFNVDAPVVGLIASTSSLQYGRIEERLIDPKLKAHIQQLALADSIRFFGNVLLDAPRLRRFSGDAPLNTDDHPRVVFEAPRVAYHMDTRPYTTLMRLIEISDSMTGERRLKAYWQARNTYLRGLVDEAEGNETGAMERFIESARLSEDFTPGYARCITVASMEARSNPEHARQLLQRLVAAQPSQQLARDMLTRLFQ